MSMRMVALSIAHSSGARGAINQKVGVDEYEVSARATEAAASVLRAAGIPYCVIDASDTKPSVYAEFKTAAINRINPLLAVEIHCNSAKDGAANYGEVIHHPASVQGGIASWAISHRLRDTFAHSTHKWPWRGAREWSEQKDGHRFFFLSRTNCPAAIIEGGFLSNDEQARWFKSPGGAETYGYMVGEGIADYFKLEKL